MSPIQNVAVLGGWGSIGKNILPKLRAENFRVTVIVRPDSKHVEHHRAGDGQVQVKIASYSDLAAMTAAFEGQDAVVEAFNPSSQVHQRTIVQAALAAGVSHLITPDFSNDRFNPNIEEILIFNQKVEAQRELETLLEEAHEKARRDGAPARILTWTAIITGLWYDWTIETGNSWVNKEARTITRYGSGNQRQSMAREKLCGDYLIEVLRNPEKYKNRPVYCASVNVTTNELIALVAELDGDGEPWQIIDVPVEELMQNGHKLWDEVSEKGTGISIYSEAYACLFIGGLHNEVNRYGADFGDKNESRWDEGHDGLKERLRQILF